MLGEQALSIRPIGSMIQGIHRRLPDRNLKTAAADPPSKTMRPASKSGDDWKHPAGDANKSFDWWLQRAQAAKRGKTEIPKTYFVQVSNDAR